MPTAAKARHLAPPTGPVDRDRSPRSTLQHPSDTGATGSNHGNIYTRLAKATSRFCGRPAVFMVAIATIVVWAVTGPLFGFSDTWQLLINTSTTIITFLMVFLIQNTQNRDTEAIQVKLDELIRATKGARNALMDMEELDDEQLQALRATYAQMAEAARKTAAEQSER